MNRKQRAQLTIAAPDLAYALNQFVGRGYCFSCGCDQWNTSGCPICHNMRLAYSALAKAGLVEPRQFAPWLEADERNRRNQANAAGWDLLQVLKRVKTAFEHSNWGDNLNELIKDSIDLAEGRR